MIAALDVSGGAALRSPLVDNNLEDLSVLAKVGFAAQCCQQLFFTDPGVQAGDVHQIALYHTKAREVFAVQRLDLAFLRFVFAFLVCQSFFLALLSFEPSSS